MRKALAPSLLIMSWLASSNEICGSNGGVGGINSISCSRGQGEPPFFCTATSLSVQLSPTSISLHLPLAPDLLESHGAARLWNITSMPARVDEGSLAECSQATAYFITIPYSNSIGGYVNYYQWHVDVLLPLYVAFERNQLPGEASASSATHAIIYPAISEHQWTNSQSSTAPAIDWSTQAFDDPTSFWMHTLEIMSGGPVKPLAQHAMNPTESLPSTTHYSTALLGLPSVEHPSAPVMLRFVRYLRHRMSLSPEPLPCSAPNVVGFVRRSNRRVLLNEADLAAAVEAELGVTVEWLEFGHRGFLEDVGAVQPLRVLVGGQGSGLTNGLYLRPRSAVVCLYQLGGWDVFEEYLKPRGPYHWWVNTNPEASVCNKTIDRFCDSPDTVIDIPTAVEVIGTALAAARVHCNADMPHDKKQSELYTSSSSF